MFKIAKIGRGILGRLFGQTNLNLNLHAGSLSLSIFILGEATRKRQAEKRVVTQAPRAMLRGITLTFFRYDV